MRALRVFTAFSGYDSQCMALDRIGVDYELVGWSEIDKYAIQAHNAVYPQWADRNYGDISKIEWEKVPNFDLFTYSSPCQDFSQAGMQRGGEKDSGTRSSLLWECERAIRAKKPKYLLMENVSALVSKKFINEFNKWQHTLEQLGYTNHAQVLNAKHYGVPQNRERIFLVSILGNNVPYYFPKPRKLDKKLLDMLEDNVAERYYISDEKVQKMIAHCDRKQLEEQKVNVLNKTQEGLLPTLRACYYKVGAYSILFASGGHRHPGVIEIGCDENTTAKRPVRIRKLTERECFRLMGVSEMNIDKIQSSGISRSQQYKMAGNSIVVDTISAIMYKMFVKQAEMQL